MIHGMRRGATALIALMVLLVVAAAPAPAQVRYPGASSGSGAIAGIAGLVDGQAPPRQGIRRHHPHRGRHGGRPGSHRRVLGRHGAQDQRALGPQELPERPHRPVRRAGTIDLAATLAQLGIDDTPPLTPAEKQATVAT